MFVLDVTWTLCMDQCKNKYTPKDTLIPRSYHLHYNYDSFNPRTYLFKPYLHLHRHSHIYAHIVLHIYTLYTCLYTLIQDYTHTYIRLKTHLRPYNTFINVILCHRIISYTFPILYTYTLIYSTKAP